MELKVANKYPSNFRFDLELINKTKNKKIKGSSPLLRISLLSKGTSLQSATDCSMYPFLARSLISY